MSNTFKIAVIPGDGIGPEVVKQALRVLSTLTAKTDLKLELTEYDFGGIAIDNHGTPLPQETLDACLKADAILMGSVGGPKWGVGPVRPEQGLLKLRKELGLYANIRPANFASESLLKHSPLKPEVAQGFDMVVVRELIGGVYFGDRQETDDKGVAWDTTLYSIPEVERITRVACQIASAESPALPIHSIDKANVLATSRLWRTTVTKVVEKEFPHLKLDHQLVDSAAMIMISNPRKLNGVILTENMFGDILSDESSVIPGSLGLLPSASLAGVPSLDKTCLGLYEPIHGSAPDIAGQNIANPLGTILSAALMLKYSLGRPKEAELIETAVRKVLDSKDVGGEDLRTRDLGGESGTTEMGDRVVQVLERLLHNNQCAVSREVHYASRLTHIALPLYICNQMYTAQPLPYYPTLSSPPTTQPSNSVPSQRSSTESTADTSLLSELTSDTEGGAGGKSWGHLDLSLGLGASLRRNGWTSNNGDHKGQSRPEEVESPEDPYQINANWSNFADDLIVVDEDETEVEGETERQEDETANQPSTSSRRFSSSFRDSRFQGSHQTDLLVDVTPPFSSSTPPPASYHPFPSLKPTQSGGEAIGSSLRNPGGRPSLQTLLNSIEDRTLQLHQESISGINRSYRSSSRPSQHPDTNHETPLVNHVRPNGFDVTASAPRASSDAVQRLKEAMNRARSTRESSPVLPKQSSTQQTKTAQKRESRSRAAVENWLEETSAELSPPLRSNSQEDEPAEILFQSPSLPPAKLLLASPHAQTSKSLHSTTSSGRRMHAHPSFSSRSPRLSNHHPHSLREVPKEEDEVAEKLSSASSEQDSPPTPPPRLLPHFSRRSPSSFVVAPPSSPPSPPPRITLPPPSASLKTLHDHRQSPEPRSEYSTPARSSMSSLVATPVLNTPPVRDIQTPAAPTERGRTPYQTRVNRTDRDVTRARGESKTGGLETEHGAQEVNQQTEISLAVTKPSSPYSFDKASASSISQSSSHQTPLQSSSKASSSKYIPVVSSKSPRTQLNAASKEKSGSLTSASTSPVWLQSSLAPLRDQISPRWGPSTPVGTPSKKVQFEPKTPAAPGGWGWTPYQPKIRRDITRTENKGKERNQAGDQTGQDLDDPNKGADKGVETKVGFNVASEKEVTLVHDAVSPDHEDAKIGTTEVTSDERTEDRLAIVGEKKSRKEDSLATEVIVSDDGSPAAPKQEDEREQHGSEEVHPDAKFISSEIEFHSVSLSPTRNPSSQECLSSQDHRSSIICSTAPATPPLAKFSQHSSQTPIFQSLSQTPTFKTPAAPGAWGWTPFPFKRRPSTLASQSPVVSSSLPQTSPSPSTPPKVSCSPRSPSQITASYSADQTGSPLPKKLAFGPPSTTNASSVTSALSTVTTTASPSRLRIAHLRAQLNKAEEDEGAARRRVQSARKDWESVKWIRGKAGDIGPREPRAIRAKVGTWTILGWCAVIAWVCFSIARYVYDGYNDPLTSSPFHPALYSPPESSSPLFTASMGLPPGLSAFEIPGQIQTGWNLLLRDWIAAEWLKLK
ncbi:3-isopropylmalate dehydrogenase [Phaffia rhodozyma]|uniref:3-isopropylmalate dehydrogenase n=1 Tax=Phaffia rhodozyma TaxID=264483 RepID=A0A0F7SV91_PHARH|nr:3-isopropylmalate dehydrogenase [Phaffia rhodozyma]